MSRSGEGVKGRCLPWSKEEERAYIFWLKQVPVGGLFWSTCKALRDWSVFFAEYYLPRGRLFSEFSDFFSFMECKIQMIIEFVFGGIFKERKWRWAIIWNEFSHGIKYQTFNCKKEYVSACDILVGIHSSDAEPGLKKHTKKLTNRVALYMLIRIDNRFCWFVVNEWWKCWAEGYTT